MNIYKNSKIKYASEAPRGDKNKVFINSIKAREILDSRGNWTIEVELTTKDGVFSAGVPAGASKGKHEAKALEAKKAVRNINRIIAPKLIGQDPREQEKIDRFLIKLDGTKNKSKLGANAICGVSTAVCRAGAAASSVPLYQHIAQIFNLKKASSVSQLKEASSLPPPRSAREGEEDSSLLPPRSAREGNLPAASFNVINGGVHAGNQLDFQEFMIVPRAATIKKSLTIAVEIYQELKKIIRKKYGAGATNVGDEGGFAPPITSAQEAIELILKAAKNLGCENKIKIVLDAAASQFYVKGNYKMKIGLFNRKALLDYYSNLVKKYPIAALEDPFAESDWQGFQEITKKLGKKVVIIGDDLLVSHPEVMRKAKAKNLCHGLLLKVNQIGTITEALAAARLARSYGWPIMVSHRSGETGDDFIADLASGIGSEYIKAGAPARGERTAKYNRLLKIEQELAN